MDATPEDCALVIVGDSDADYADEIEVGLGRLEGRRAWWWENGV